jgi:hypothetical protein
MYLLLLMLIKDGTRGIESCNKSAKNLFESLALTQSLVLRFSFNNGIVTYVI